jgi:hypothetical protein
MRCSGKHVSFEVSGTLVTFPEIRQVSNLIIGTYQLLRPTGPVIRWKKERDRRMEEWESGGMGESLEFSL